MKLPRHTDSISGRPSDDNDKISKLPESVLYRILSLLPTKEVVATSILSKRWKFIWKNIRNLDFSDYDWPKIEGGNLKFVHFVNKVLLLLSGDSIDKFTLRIEENGEVFDITTWIEAALAKNVKEIMFCVDVLYPNDPRIQMPCSLYTSKTLNQFILCGFMHLNVPSFVCLPNLKYLSHESVSFKSDESVRNLISGCSMLKDLFIERNVYDNVVNFTISSPTLTCLCYRFYEFEYGFPRNIEYKLEINAPELRSLELIDTLSRDFSIGSLCLLREANIETATREEANRLQVDYDDYSKVVVKLLQGLCNVKELQLHASIVEALRYASAFPSFSKLTQLMMQCFEFDFLLNMVDTSNKLQQISLNTFYDPESTYETSWTEPEQVPACFLSCLDTVTMNGFTGVKEELALVTYILKNAKVLRRMTINTDSSLDLERKFQLLLKVSMFCRDSKQCQIAFS